MKLTMFEMFTVEGTEQECADYTARLLVNLQMIQDKQDAMEVQKAVDSVIKEFFGTKQ